MAEKENNEKCHIWHRNDENINSIVSDLTAFCEYANTHLFDLCKALGLDTTIENLVGFSKGCAVGAFDTFKDRELAKIPVSIRKRLESALIEDIEKDFNDICSEYLTEKESLSRCENIADQAKYLAIEDDTLTFDKSRIIEDNTRYFTDAEYKKFKLHEHITAEVRELFNDAPEIEIIRFMFMLEGGELVPNSRIVNYYALANGMKHDHIPQNSTIGQTAPTDWYKDKKI